MSSHGNEEGEMVERGEGREMRLKKEKRHGLKRLGGGLIIIIIVIITRG